MHELTITQNILEIAVKKANEAKASKVTRISLTLGELSGIVDECVQFYFDFLNKDTIAAGASLSFDKVPTRLRCSSCATVFTPGDSIWICPSCQEQKIEIIAGRECYVNSIEVS